MKLQNRKKLLSILIAIILFTFTGYLMFFKTNFEKFLISEVNSYVVVDKNLFEFLTPKNSSENKKFKKLIVNIKKAMILSFDQGFNPKLVEYEKSILLFNTGTHDLSFNIKLYEYFEKEEDLWILKDRYIKNFKELGIVNDGEKIYLKKYGRTYILGKNLSLIKYYDKSYKKSRLNEKLIETYKEKYNIAQDLSKEERFGLKTYVSKGQVTLEDSKIKFLYRVYFKDKKDLDNFYINKNKTVAKYYENDGLYFDISGLKPLTFLIFLYSIEYEKQNENIKKVNWKRIIDEANSEFYFIPDKNAVLIENKDSEFINLLFNVVTEKENDAYILGNQRLYITENFLHINHKFEKNNKNLIEPDVFLKGRVRSKQLMGYFGLNTEKFTNIYVELEGRVKESYIEISAELDADTYKKYLQE